MRAREEAWGPRDPGSAPWCEAGCQGYSRGAERVALYSFTQRTPNPPWARPCTGSWGVNSEKDTGSHQQALRTDSYTVTGRGSERWVGEVHGVGLEHSRGASGTGGQEGFLREGTLQAKVRGANYADT